MVNLTLATTEKAVECQMHLNSVASNKLEATEDTVLDFGKIR